MGNFVHMFFSFTIKSIFLVQLIISTPVFVNASGNEADELALLAFKSLIKFERERILSSWNNSLHFCDWQGVICGRKHRRVTILDLQSKRLVGSVSPHIGNLSFLKEIRLQNNSFHGEIPNQIGRLFRLQALVLHDNSFGGEIPSNLSYCSNLQNLSLKSNKLAGGIPGELENLSFLEYFSIRENHLIGEIPAFLGNFSSLEHLNVGFNGFEGPIPHAIGKLKYLSFISLQDNKLSGSIPPSIYNVSSIELLALANNLLVGSIPSNIGLMLPRLQVIDLNLNKFSGSIPLSLSNASNLWFIDFSKNNFIGNIDEIQFGSLKQLEKLWLFTNGLVSSNDLSFISFLTNCSKLVWLDASDNLFHGMMPSSLVNLSSTIERVDVSVNRIYGSIPLGLSNFDMLATLFMDHNQITGTIPKDIGGMQNLRILGLENNRLSGKIPSSIGNLSSLTNLLLENNILQGVIPSTLGNCHNLISLILSENKFSVMPNLLFPTNSMLVFLDISNNQLVGALPTDIGNLFNLNELYLSHNHLSGEIPKTLAGCKSLEILHLENNRFHGNLPTGLESLMGLRQLNLSQNQLSGQIPEYLEKFALKYLNLSFNDFEGVVPIKGVFLNASALSLEGNNRLCGGIRELQLPRCINEEVRRHVVKIVLIVISCVFGVAFLAVFLCCRIKRKKSKQSDLHSLQITPIQKVSYQQIRLATDGFSSANLIGMGSFGSVYKGKLDQDGEIVAIKVLNLQRPGASKSFIKECEALGKSTRHRNLLKIITCCSSIDSQGNDFKAIVYEYLPNGNLGSWLYPESEEENAKFLSFRQRVNIAIDVGNALDHLHHHCEEPIIHCDLKPTNILLNNDMVAHVGDFGLAKFLCRDTNQVQSSSVGVRGTIGYAAPEYGVGSVLSKEGDVYSYGIMLLEMMTGKKPTDAIFSQGDNIHKFACMALREQVLEIIDPILMHDDECKVEWLISILKIGVECSMEAPRDRMNITDAVSSLSVIRNSFSGARRRSFATNPNRFAS